MKLSITTDTGRIRRPDQKVPTDDIRQTFGRMLDDVARAVLGRSGATPEVTSRALHAQPPVPVAELLAKLTEPATRVYVERELEVDFVLGRDGAIAPGYLFDRMRFGGQLLAEHDRSKDAFVAVGEVYERLDPRPGFHTRVQFGASAVFDYLIDVQQPADADPGAPSGA